MNHCLLCGKEIDDRRKFCSSSHSAIYNNSLRPKKFKVCVNCGKKMCGYEWSRNKFCSQECFSDYVLKENDARYLNGEISHMSTLKSHYLRYNFYECDICGISHWQGKDLVLILDHIDGNHENNHPYNLRLVCPNCDSQLPTFKKRNNGNGRKYRRERYAEGKSY